LNLTFVIQHQIIFHKLTDAMGSLERLYKPRFMDRRPKA
jgi:hypothetical protein